MMMKSLSIFFLIACLLANSHAFPQKAGGSPLACAAGHAHNDYRHTHPLHDALTYRFKSIEVDVFPLGDSLYVAHDDYEITEGRTLPSLYLDPLLKVVKDNQGSVYGDGSEVLLVIDIKRDAVRSFLLLEQILSDYQSLLSTYDEAGLTKKAVKVIISGGRAIDTLLTRKSGHIFLDGRMNELDTAIPAHLMPLVSGAWGDFFSWDGTGLMPDVEQKRLASLAGKARAAGSLLRFWGAPNHSAQVKRNVWNCLSAEPNVLIGADDLKALRTFYTEKAGQYPLSDKK
ncbi:MULTISPECIES: hypothetical protein [unclassified Carboxylicivirga]|uniref:hypothetical protein n=1 Tax=Carboxylicivirga TaxID=1628153 RepID=UPI003D352579